MTEPPLPEESVFAQALEMPVADRAAFLDRACAGNPALRAEVEALLRAHDRSGDVLDLPEPSPPTADLPAGERPGMLLGPYKLLEPIGEGGMGAVWMAQQSEPIRRRVAVKVIKEGMDSRQVLARFEAERHALALMDHPNIARVLDAGRTPAGRPYFVMELVKGQPITQYCDGQRLGVRERLGLFADVCRAVQHAHQKGIIHRDLKPSNVLVAPYDGRPVVKVIDFGVAKATGQSLTDQTLFTGFGAVVGTPEYMSPEQAEVNNQDIDTRSDVYSLGVLLYELLTGSTPLTRKRAREAALLEVLRVIREEEPPRPSTRLTESKDALPSVAAQRQTEPARLTKLVRGELDWIAMKALEKDRNRRYETANGLAADVQRYLADEPVQACPPSAAYRLRKVIRRNKVWVGTAALIGAVLIVATAVSVTQAIRARQAEDVARHDRDRAEEQSGLATERAEDLARRLYIHRVNLAHREALANNVAQADALLDDCEPARRGWEWTYSRRLCHLEAMTLGGFADHAAAVAGARRGPPSGATTGDPETDRDLRALAGVVGTVRGVAYSPDGSRIASAHDDGAVVIWDARTGRPLRALAGHVGPASSVTFDAGGGRVISGGFDRTVRVWDAKTGAELLVLRGHSRAVMRLAVRPGADQVAASSYGAFETFFERGFEIKLWDLATGRAVRTLYHRRGWGSTSIAFSPDGRRLLSSAGSGGYLRFWDVDGGKEVEERPIADFSSGLDVSRTDGRVAFGSSGNAVGLTAPGLGANVTPCVGHGGSVLAVAFSPDGRRVASASVDGAVKVWDTADGHEVFHFRGHTGNVTAVAFRPDGRAVASASEDGTVKIWVVPPAPDPFPFRVFTWGFRVRFAPDGGRVAVSRFFDVLVFDAASHRLAFRIVPPANSGGVYGLAYSRDGRLIATCTEFSEWVRVWDAATGQPVSAWQGHAGKTRTVAFGADHRLATAGDDGTVRLWEATTGRPGPVIRAHEGGAFGAAFDPAGATLATIGWDGAVRLWDAATGGPIRQLGTTVQHRSDYFGDALAFDPDGRRLAAASDDGTVHVWDVATGAEVFILRGHTQEVNGVAYSPDGKRLVSGASDHTLKLWDATTGEEVFTLRGHTGAVLGFGFSPDGNRIVSTGADAMAWAWNGTPPGQEEGRGPPPLVVEAAAPVPETPRLATVPETPRLAVIKYSLALAALPLNPEARLRRGRACYLLGLWRQAADDLGVALALSRVPDPQAWFELAYASGACGQDRQAFAAYSRTVELSPGYHGAWNNRGLLQERAGRLEPALADYSAALAVNDRNAVARNNRSRVYARLGRWGAAAEDCSRYLALASGPAQAEGFYRRATAYARLGRYREALADYQKLLGLVPGSTMAQNDFAWLLATCPDPKLRNPARAIELAQKAVRLAPNDGTFWNTLGTAHYRAGDWKAAVAAIDKSMEKSKGGSAYDWLVLAMARAKLGDRAAARKEYDRAARWMQANAAALAKDRHQAEELGRFRREAEEVLGLKK